MEMSEIMSLLHGWLFLLIAFAGALGVTMFKGRQLLIDLMAGSYLATFLYLQFPYLEILTNQAYGERSQAIISLLVFLFFTFLASWLFARLMPREYLEKPFESIVKKVILAVGATILILVLSTHFLPVGEIINISTPIPDQFLSENLVFAWLILPLVILFVV